VHLHHSKLTSLGEHIAPLLERQWVSSASMPSGAPPGGSAVALCGSAIEAYHPPLRKPVQQLGDVFGANALVFGTELCHDSVDAQPTVTQREHSGGSVV
jgi:hypothetical protein